jgi:hypothetical protein
MPEPWPPAPVGISGRVVLKLLGLKLAVITLDLAIVAKHRFAQWVEAAEAGEQGQPLSPGAGSHAARPALTGNGQRTANDGELEEILQLLDKTSKLLD